MQSDSNQESTAVTSKLPRLTPRPSLLSTVPKFIKVSENSNSSHLSVQNENKSIVGSVTTWFPSSSTIQVSQDVDSANVSENTSIIPPPRPQHVEVLGNRKFIIIPKHNIVSVSPTIAAAAAPSNKPVNSNVSETTTVLGFTFTNKVAAEGTTNITSTLDSASLGPSDIPKIKTESPSHPEPFLKDPLAIEENMETDNAQSVQDDDTSKISSEETKENEDDQE